MKDARLGQYLLWEGKPAKIVAEVNSRMVVVELLENCKCPHCKGDLGKDQTYVVVSSPMFQNGAERMESITDDPTLIIS
jgi:hypothetical protein